MTDDDLKYDPKGNPGPIDVNRAFTIAELVIFRYRDHHTKPNTPEYELLSEIALAIYKISQTWKGPTTL